MLIFGHLGIGLRLARPFSVPAGWLFLGTLAPDLLDKTLYYGLSVAHGLHGAQLGLVSGTRTFGHTAVFLILLALLAAFSRSKIAAAVALGVATHILVDHLGDAIGYSIWPQPDRLQLDEHGRSLSMVGLLWPLLGNRFPVNPHAGLSEHLTSASWRPHVWIGEVLGLWFLARDQRAWERLWKRAYSPFKPKSSS